MIRSVRDWDWSGGGGGGGGGVEGVLQRDTAVFRTTRLHEKGHVEFAAHINTDVKWVYKNYLLS